MQIQFTRIAAAELESAAQWYRERASARVSERLRAELAEVRELLLTQPGIGAPHAMGTRKLSLDQFPYSMIYRVTGDIVRVIAFMHHRRDPKYWWGRH